MSVNESYNIVVVDDHPIWREGVVKTLEDCPEFTVVGRGSNADEAFKLVSEHLPDVILLDVSMPGCGIGAAQRISISFPVVKVVMLTVSENEDTVLSALKAHAKGYILKGVGAQEFVSIIKKICSGETYITPSLATSLLMESRDKSRSTYLEANLPDLLNDREREILEKLSSGLSNKEIAEKINLSEKTVKHYMTNIMQKLQVRNRVQAALIAHGLSVPTLDEEDKP